MTALAMMMKPKMPTNPTEIDPTMIRSALLIVCAALSAYSSESLQPRKLLDQHSAGVLPRAKFDIETRVYPSGTQTPGAGLGMTITFGVTDRLNIGVGYGADGLIGRNNQVKPNPWPGALIKYRIFEESFHFPAVVIGVEGQGYGGIATDYLGFNYKSQGAFITLSKNYLLGKSVNFGLHGGPSYSFEDISHVKWPDAWVGADLGLNEELSIIAEYDLGLNQLDLHEEVYANPFHGFLNLGLRWSVVPELSLEFSARDIMENRRAGAAKDHSLGWGREFKVVYLTGF